MTTLNWIAFTGHDRIAKGEPTVVAAAVKQFADANDTANLLVFDMASSQPVELDLRGTLDEVTARVTETLAVQEPKRRRGRPKLGVVSKEVTLLPRHWDWLQAQPGGASVTLRKLVETASKAHDSGGNPQQQLESAYRFMTAIGGNLPGYEEGIRALFAKDGAKFKKALKKWPKDVRKHVRNLAEAALGK